MVIVRGYLDGKEVYNKEWEDADDIGFIEVEVEDENGYIWHP